MNDDNVETQRRQRAQHAHGHRQSKNPRDAEDRTNNHRHIPAGHRGEVRQATVAHLLHQFRGHVLFVADGQARDQGRASRRSIRQ